MSNSLDAVLQQYEKNKSEVTNTSNKKMSDEERKKKYFSPQLGKNETTGEKRIRILPAKDGSPFVEVWYHEVNLDGKWTKIYDPGKNENKPSPLNDTHAALMAEGTKRSKDLASQYKSKKFFIVKVIDRDNESDGPKFWRFKDKSYKGDGILDKIIPLYKKRGELHNPVTGRDLTLSLSRATTNSGVAYTNIVGVIDEDPSPLHTDEATAKAWLEDTLTWEDVYSKKPLEFLQGVAAGFSPKWSTKSKKYIWGDMKEEEADLSTETDASQFLQEEPAIETPDEDLPF